MCKFSICIIFCCHHSCKVLAKEGKMVLGIGGNALFMQAVKDSISNGFRLAVPGIYFKLAGESAYSAKTFTQVELNLSLNYGSIENGTIRTSRLCYNYGFGKYFGPFKLCLLPGLTYVTSGYYNNRSKQSYVDTRFSFAVGLQADWVLIQSNGHFMSLFIEASLMAAKPDRWANQVAMGVNWKPEFLRKKELPVQSFF